MALSKLLVATDFSLCSDIATKHALNTAKTTGASIVLAHVWDPAGQDIWAFTQEGGAPALHERVLRDAYASHRDELAMRADHLRARGVHARHLLLEGPVDEAICHAARHEAADMVIVGTHGRHPFKRLLLGSVAERILRRCHVPVMIARESSRPTYEHILVPTDFSPHAEHALCRALDLAPDGGVIDLVHCWSSALHLLTGATTDDERQGAEAEAGERAAELIATHDRAGVRVRFVFTHGSPTRGILELADRGEYDLICLGSHGRRGARKLLIGSVAGSVARHARCSVVVCQAPTAT